MSDFSKITHHLNCQGTCFLDGRTDWLSVSQLTHVEGHCTLNSAGFLLIQQQCLCATMSRHWAEDTGLVFGRWSHKVLRLSVDVRKLRTQKENGGQKQTAWLQEAWAIPWAETQAGRARLRCNSYWKGEPILKGPDAPLGRLDLIL